MNCEECDKSMLVMTGWHTIFGVPIESSTTVYICPVGHILTVTKGGF